MSHKIGTIREFNTKNFKVVVDAIEDYNVDLSFDEDGSTRKGLESGDLICFCARVRVYFKGQEVASDYLGGCIYESLDAFMDHKECGKQNAEYEAKERAQHKKIGSTGRRGSYFSDMITAACEEARKTILDRRAAYADVSIRTKAAQ